MDLQETISFTQHKNLLKGQLFGWVICDHLFMVSKKRPKTQFLKTYGKYILNFLISDSASTSNDMP